MMVLLFTTSWRALIMSWGVNVVKLITRLILALQLFLLSVKIIRGFVEFRFYKKLNAFIIDNVPFLNSLISVPLLIYY